MTTRNDGRTALADDERPSKERMPDEVRDMYPELAHPRWIESVKRELEEQYRERNTTIAALRDLRFMQHEVKIPAAYQDLNPAGPVKSYTLGKSIETAVGALASLDPKIHIPVPPRPTKEEQQNVSAMERFLSAYLQQLNRQPGSRDYFVRFIDSLIGDGVGVIKNLYTPGAWHGLPTLRTFFKDRDIDATLTDPDIAEQLDEKDLERFNMASDRFVQQSHLPFTIEALDVLTYFPLRGGAGTGTDAALEVTQRPLSSAKRIAGVWGGLPTVEYEATTGKTVTLVEFWNADVMAVYAQSGKALQLVGAMRHEQGRIPYYEALGQATSSNDPRFESISSAFKLQHTIPQVDQLLNMSINTAALLGYPMLQAGRRQAGSEEEPQEDIKIEQGVVYEYDPGQGETKIEAIRADAEIGAIQAMAQILLSLSDSTQMGPAAQGQGRFSGDSGYLQAQLTELAKTGYHQVPKHASWAMSDMCNWMLETIERKIGREVWAISAKRPEERGKRQRNWLSLKPSQINGYYNVDVQIRTHNPIMDVATGTYFDNKAERKMIPRRAALELQGYEQPEELQAEVAAETLMEQPEIQSALTGRGLAELGIVRPEQLGFNDQGQLVDPQMLQSVLGLLGGRPTGSPAIPGAGAALNAPNNNPAAVPTDGGV